jgi:hypothetical protein
MKYTIIISLTAQKEEAEAYLFYEKISDGLGERFLEEVENTLEKIAANPTHYSYVDSTNSLRDFALEKFPFVIIYEILADKIIVTNIHHTKKDLK